MEIVWIVMKDEGYGYKPEGACSSKEKADSYIAACEEMYGYEERKIFPCRIDEILDDVASDIEQSIGHYDKMKTLLEHLKEES